MEIHAGRSLHGGHVLVFALTLAVSGLAQEKGANGSAQEQPRVTDPARPVPSPQYSPGHSATIEGTIATRDADRITLRTFRGSTVAVALTGSTEVKEKKNNPFRRARNYATTQLLPGLDVEVKGHSGSSGSLVADEIRFTNDDLRVAAELDARVAPVETRLGQNEQNALRLSGQVSELSAVSNAARGGARAAQGSADAAMESAKKANESAEKANESAENAKAGIHATNERISSLDDFDTRDNVTVNFKAGSVALSPEAKAALDELAGQAQNEKGYIVEVTGFASAEGGADYNRALSQRRADAVIRYLAENHDIPLRRFITPFGYGSLQPVADNKTRSGRIQNRRVEVHILVSKGLRQVVSTSAATR